MKNVELKAKDALVKLLGMSVLSIPLDTWELMVKQAVKQQLRLKLK